MLLDDAAALFRDGEHVPRAGVLLALPAIAWRARFRRLADRHHGAAHASQRHAFTIGALREGLLGAWEHEPRRAPQPAARIQCAAFDASLRIFVIAATPVSASSVRCAQVERELSPRAIEVRPPHFAAAANMSSSESRA